MRHHRQACAGNRRSADARTVSTSNCVGGILRLPGRTESGTRLDWTSCGVPTAPTRSCSSCSGLSVARAAPHSVPTRRTPCTGYFRDTFTGWKLAHRNADFTLNVDKVLEAIAEVKPSMVLLTSPNNPTGTPLPMEIETCSRRRCRRPLQVWSARARACIRFSSSTKRTWNSANPAPRAP